MYVMDEADVALVRGVLAKAQHETRCAHWHDAEAECDCGLREAFKVMDGIRGASSEVAVARYELSEARRELEALRRNYSALGEGCDEAVRERDAARWAAVVLADRVGLRVYPEKVLVRAVLEGDWEAVGVEKEVREVFGS